MNCYSASQHKQARVAVEYILPSLMTIVGRDPAEPQIGPDTFDQVLDCLLHWMQMQQDKAEILLSYDVTKLLLCMVAHETH